MFISIRAMMVAALLALTLGGASRAEYVVNLTETGGDVVAIGSGTINTAGLTYHSDLGGGTSTPQADNGTALFGSGVDASGSHVAVFFGISGPASFGVGTELGGTSGTGDFVGIFGGGELWLTFDYVSGSPLNSTSTWSGSTFSSLGLTPGTYVWTWGTGANADSFTMNIGVSSVPEPTSLVLAGCGLGLAGLVVRVRRRKVTRV